MEVLFYLLKNVAATSLLFGVYALILKDRVVPATARFYLLCIAVFSVVIPFITLPASFSTAIPVFSMPGIVVPTWAVGRGESNFLIVNILSIPMLYGLTALGHFIAFFIQLGTMVRLLKQGKIHTVTNKITIVTNVKAGPGSFGRYVFFPAGEVNETILQHEVCHVQRGHSADIVVLRLLRCILWPNFLLAYILKELRMVHEYEADAFAARTNPQYGTFLLNQAFSTSSFSLCNTFFSHPIKRRIIMLQNNKVQHGAVRQKVMVASAAGLLLMAGMVYLQSCKPAIAPSEPSAVSKVGATAFHGEADNTKMPEAKVDLVQFLSANIKYPDAAKTKKITGRVVVKLVIDETGKLVETEVKRSPDELLTAEALRVIRLIPGWKPGTKDNQPVKTEMYLPVAFVL